MKTMFASIALIIFGCGLSAAQIPRTLSYQGVLTNLNGTPKPDNTYYFTFRLFDIAEGGTAIYAQQESLATTKGVFSTTLGSRIPFGPAVVFDRQYWLEVQITGEPPLSPRVALTSVGYSMNALRADTANVSNSSSGRIDGPLEVRGSNLKLGTADGQPIGSLPNQRALVHDVGDVLIINYAGDFEGGTKIHGPQLEITGSNLKLGTADGQPIGSLPNQRALVHDVGDVLVINYAEDFEGGTRVAGRLKTNVLEILGGSDLAEPFEMSHTEALDPGSVVIIDEDNPGKLKLSSEPYDKRVAGVVSGAGGLNPGLTLKQEGLMENGQNVALTGRVYVKATTVNGSIKPGDLLTTSTISGLAMKATETQLSHGAVIGKAMSRLVEGEGLVLLLIQPQ